MAATDGTSRSSFLRDADLGVRVSTLLAGSITVALVIGGFLCIRRVTGAFAAPLPGLQLVITAAGLCVWAGVVRELSAPRQVFYGLALCALVLFAISCSFPARRLADWLVWPAAIGFTMPLPLVKRLKWRRPARRRLPSTDGEASRERVLQQLSRVRTADGKDAIRGMLLAEFAPGQRQTTVYVGFCPPFELLPQVEVNVADDAETEVKLAQVLHNGAQLEVRLSEPAEEAVAVTIEFFAVGTGKHAEEP